MITQDEIRLAFNGTHPEGFYPLTKFILRNRSVRETENHANDFTHVYAAFDELDWTLASIFPTHERWDMERN